MSTVSEAPSSTVKSILAPAAPPSSSSSTVSPSWRDKGNTHFVAKRFQDALYAYTEGVNAVEHGISNGNTSEKDKDEGEASKVEAMATLLCNRALCHLKMGSVAAAEQDCTKALKLDGNRIKALYRRAQAREVLGNVGGAMADLRNILTLEPDNLAGLKLTNAMRERHGLATAAGNGGGDTASKRGKLSQGQGRLRDLTKEQFNDIKERGLLFVYEDDPDFARIVYGDDLGKKKADPDDYRPWEGSFFIKEVKEGSNSNEAVKTLQGENGMEKKSVAEMPPAVAEEGTMMMTMEGQTVIGENSAPDEAQQQQQLRQQQRQRRQQEINAGGVAQEHFPSAHGCSKRSTSSACSDGKGGRDGGGDGSGGSCNGDCGSGGASCCPMMSIPVGFVAPVSTDKGGVDPRCVGPRNFTLKQLHEFDGRDFERPIYISLKLEVFDVSAGRGFYGFGQSYNMFAGHDATCSLAKMSFDPKDVDRFEFDDVIGEGEASTLQGWIQSFRIKYPVVGKLILDIPSGGDATIRHERTFTQADLLPYRGGTGNTTSKCGSGCGGAGNDDIDDDVVAATAISVPPGWAIAPIYVALGGYVFDMSFGGAPLFGVGGPYHCLSGRDATRALAKISLLPEDIDNDGVNRARSCRSGSNGVDDIGDGGGGGDSEGESSSGSSVGKSAIISGSSSSSSSSSSLNAHLAAEETKRVKMWVRRFRRYKRYPIVGKLVTTST